MKNLAGETKANLHILKELDKANIEIIENIKSNGEVPYTIIGNLGNWSFNRAWTYWIASTKGDGLSLEVATKLHNKKYSIQGEGVPKIFGKVIRVGGHAGAPSPNKWPMTNSYHVDTQEGLNALAEVINNTYKLNFKGNDQKRVEELRKKFSSQFLEWEVSGMQGDNIEWLKKLPVVAYDNKTENELIIAIKDESVVASIGEIWKDKDGIQRVAQYFFKDGKINSANWGHCSGPTEMLDRSILIDKKLSPHFRELKDLRPKAAESLELCLHELEILGPQYKPKFPGP